jgi:adenylate kinase family enzyme
LSARAGRGKLATVRRVMIVGSGGAGKSALARQVGAITGLPVVHLDHHYWGPGWQPTPGPVWVEQQRVLLGGPEWIADGHYGGTLELRARLADTIVFLDLPRRICLARAVRRLRSPILQAPGCPQKVDLAFLRWIWSFPRETRPKVLAMLGRHAATTDVVHLRSAADTRRFLSRARKERGPAVAQAPWASPAPVSHPR